MSLLVAFVAPSTVLGLILSELVPSPSKGFSVNQSRESFLATSLSRAAGAVLLKRGLSSPSCWNLWCMVLWCCFCCCDVGVVLLMWCCWCGVVVVMLVCCCCCGVVGLVLLLSCCWCSVVVVVHGVVV